MQRSYGNITPDCFDILRKVLIEVFMPPVRERINSRFVKKTLSLPAWLAAKADEDGVNCSRIFQLALMNYLQVSEENKAGSN